MNLFQANELARLESHIDQDTGEIDIDAFNGSQIALQDKQRAVVAYLKNEASHIDMINHAIKELQGRAKAMQTRHDSLKSYLLVNMAANGISEINALDYTFSAKLQNNPPSVIVYDEASLPADYWRVPPAPAPAPDKLLIAKALKEGYSVPGAHLQATQKLVIK